MVERELWMHVIAALRCAVLLKQLQCTAANGDVTVSRERTLENSDNHEGIEGGCEKLEALLRLLLCSSVLLL